jgi:ABC-type Fe3+-hydroxamate transport system substrate-binding protein
MRTVVLSLGAALVLGACSQAEPVHETTTVTVTPAPVTTTTTVTQTVQEPLPDSCRRVIALAREIARNTTAIDQTVGNFKVLLDDLPVALFDGEQHTMNVILGKITRLYERSGGLSSENLQDLADLNHALRECTDNE